MAVRVCLAGSKVNRRTGATLRKILELLGLLRGAWLVYVVGDREMTQLHKRTLGIATTTDVLTFDMRGGGADHLPAFDWAAVELETVICIDEAKRRAKELGHSVENELLLYCVHSLLHVQGYDDRTKAQAARMHAREDELLEAIGVGAVYKTQSAKREKQNRKRKTGNAKRETDNAKLEAGNSKLVRGGRR